MISKYLFNPFKFVAGAKSLLIGLSICIASFILASLTNTHFDGTIEVHIWPLSSPLIVHVVELLVNTIVTSSVFYISGKLFSTSRIRLIDVVGTTTLARYPMLFVSFIGMYKVGDATELIKADSIPFGLIIIGLYSLTIGIWHVVLLFNAFKVSCNVTPKKLPYVFTLALVIASIVSHITIHYLYHTIL